ncbi:MAG: sigma-70 family RNA polymerase sigma factor [Prevotellaceae bacterium]|jgi:RNA polymerase sigma-70 factor (ECF subfamily)|nr:sigma-70 family RNA polymerase sigma factor [Prevotellaceae bacterium]
MDEQLIKECIKKDIRAQKQLYERYAPLMMSVCMRYVKDRDLAHDLLQDGFIKLFDKIHTYSGSGSFVGWMRKIFVNTALEYLRRNDVLRYSVDVDAAFNIENSDESPVDKISADELMACIGELPPGFRTVFNMFAVEGYSHAEIAEQLGIQEGTSRSQYARARALLQQKILRLFNSGSNDVK